jgi:hypothetical protein
VAALPSGPSGDLPWPVNPLPKLQVRAACVGDPEYNAAPHRYEVINHGSITVASRTTYEHLLAISDRFFLSGAILSLAFALPIAGGEWVRLRPTPAGGPKAATGHQA